MKKLAKLFPVAVSCTVAFLAVCVMGGQTVHAAQPVEVLAEQRVETAPLTPVPTVPEVPTAPEVPTVPEVPTAPEVPTEPEAPTTPEVPTEPEVPTTPEAPTTPEVPAVSEAPKEVDSALLPVKPEQSDLPAEGAEAPEGEALVHTAAVEASVAVATEAPGNDDMAETNAASTHTGWMNGEDGQWSYYGQEGQHKGWLLEGNSWYYLDPTTGKMKTDWFFDGADWFYLDNGSGRMQTTWLDNNNNWYYLNPADGRMKTGWLEQNGWYYLNVSGQMQTGVKYIDGAYYDLGETGHLPASEMGTLADGGRWSLENGTWYFYDKNGQRKTGWLEEGENWYFLDYTSGQMKTDWMHDGSGWFYLRGNGQMAKGWEAVDGTWYYLNPTDGRMKTGWLEEGTNWYFLQGSGQMKTDWMHDGSSWFYLRANGQMAKGWEAVDGTWYYLNPTDGRMKTGWLEEGTNWYFLQGSGQMKTDWMHDGSGWFYMLGNGQMAKDWQLVGNSWYYLNPADGRMKTGWLEKGTTWYYLQGGGQMATGWVTVGQMQYYFNLNSGALEQEKKATVRRGIDVSSYQGNIDWAAVKASGIDFVIIRMLTWSNGDYSVDKNFDAYVRQAKAHGLQVGVYLFSYAYDEARATREVNFFLNNAVVRQHKAEGIAYDLPVFIDYEKDKTNYILNQGTSFETRTNALRTGMNLLRAGGYKAGFYSDKNWSTNVFNARQLQAEGYDFWLAYWPNGNTQGTGPESKAGWSPGVQIWQYTSNGTVPGIAGRVDMNYMY